MASLLQELVAPNGRSIKLDTGLFINNTFVAGHAEPIKTINPTDESVICEVQAAAESDVDAAVQAAKTAFQDPAWRRLEPDQRGALIYRLAELIDQHKEDLATLEAWDNGKPYQLALTEDLEEVIGVLRYYAGWADKIHGQTMANAGGYKLGYTLREPIGVCGQIIPWNYPLNMASWKLGPALACGNTIVLKAAEQTPLSILYIAKLIKQAGFPPGVVNIINGLGPIAGSSLCTHPDVHKIAFTGSTATGKTIMKLASSTLKDISLETGGKSPIIIFPDANLDQASKWANFGLMSNQGQICTATSRMLVHRGVLDEFLSRLCQSITETNIVGDPFDDETFQGPQVSLDQYNRVLGFIERAKEQGAAVVLGGRPLQNKPNGRGYFIEPTVFSQVTREMELFREEVFGPVAAVTVFDTEEEAIELANESQYGLGASVFTENIQTAHRVAGSLESGQVWINSSNDAHWTMPFGGVKQSGIGRELGEKGLDAYSSVKSVHVNLSLKV
ncbi:aldehyde dehydrogenase [Fusarium globosum]|uniref:aldehyde dehydrogenase (NAD(+)) n=1 Tax=Fusarium globosum TaxID=78864 RepID=A0A8H5XW61_9HYPO|nr:aldehyde dehydrogenase [Fusarium globosum]